LSAFRIVMARKKKIKKRETKPGVGPAVPQPGSPNEPVEQERVFDFGGLPDRDLKKNLGCG
jgi:hypothetical protein